MQSSSNILAATTVVPAHEPILSKDKGTSRGSSAQFIELMQRALAAAPRHATGQPTAPPKKANPTGEKQPTFPSPPVNRHARSGRLDRAEGGLHPAKVSAGSLERHRSPAPSHADGAATTETETADDSDCETGGAAPVAISVANFNPAVMPFICAPVPDLESGLPSEVEGSAPSNCTSASTPAVESESDSTSPPVSAAPGADENIPANDGSPAEVQTEPAPASLAGEASAPPAIATSQQADEAAAAGMDVALETLPPEAMEPAPDGPPMQVKLPVSTTVSIPPEADGTSAAQVVAAMKKVEQQDEFAAPEKEVPGDEQLSPGSGLGASHASRADRHDSFVAFSAPPVESISSRSAAVTEASLVNVTADHRISALERTHDVIAMHALRLREANAESLQIVLKPGGGLELSLELRQHEGAIEARATMQSGDFNHLNRHWADLQQRLEARGIRLTPLTCADQFLNSNTNNFQQQPDRTPKDDAPIAGAFTKFTPTTASVITTAPQLARATGRGWESWA